MSAMSFIKKKAFLKRTYLALSIFILGVLHLFIVHQATHATIELKLALVRNEFLDKPPTKIVVVGELNSGDDYVASVLRNAFGADMTILHDHIFRHDLLDQAELSDIASRSDVLWVVVVRSPCDWADAVARFHKESCRKQEMLGDRCNVFDFATETDYYRIPWYDFHGNRSSSDNDNDISGIFIKSKQPPTFKYEDIFDMRRQKLLIMKQITDAVSRHVKIVRLSEFELAPDVFVKDLVREYQFKLSTKTYKPYPPNVNPESMFFNPATIFSCMEYDKWREAQQRIDWTLEGYFGHHHFDCHLCRDSGQAGSQRLPSSPLKNMYILGERNSGTTFVSKTLAEGFDPPNTMGSKLEKFSTDIPVLLHKHMFRHDLLDETELAEIRAMDDTLWIMVVRSPCDWAEGMFRKPYHLCPPKHPEKCGPDADPSEKVWMNQNTVAGMSLLQFFTELEWKDWAESVPFLRDDGEKKKGEKGTKKEVSISKVSANYTYPSVFALRRHKLAIMKQIIETVPRNVKFVRLKELERSPEIFIQSLVRGFNVTLKDGYETQPPSPVNHETVCLTPDEWDAAQNGIDWMLEGEFGFNPSDCRMCYGYEKSTRLYNRVVEGKKTKKIIDGKMAKEGIDMKEKGQKKTAGKSTVKGDDANARKKETKGQRVDKDKQKQKSRQKSKGLEKKKENPLKQAGKQRRRQVLKKSDDLVVNKRYGKAID